MKSNPYPLDKPLREIFEHLKIRIPKSLEELEANDKISLFDFITTLPSKITIFPTLENFDHITEGKIFKGFGIVEKLTSRPIFYRKFKTKVMLSNISITLKDPISNQLIYLQFFNAYPNLVKKLQQKKEIYFAGMPQNFKGKFSFASPIIIEKEEINNINCELKYPTIKKIKSANLSKIINKIPSQIFDSLDSIDYSLICENKNIISLKKCFLILHGRNFTNSFKDNEILINKAYERLSYQKFFENNLSLKAKELNKQNLNAISMDHFQIENYLNLRNNLFNYELTTEQLNTIKDIYKDYLRSYPMTRLLQGDVGTGKTSVAIFSALPILHHKYQVVYMAPTETLALQVFNEFQKSFQNIKFNENEINIEILTGSTTQKNKTEIYKKSSLGQVDILIGTHSLLNEKLNFKKLGLVIIDEQHKFGIKQRLELSLKNPNAHCLLMTATPIPKTLSETLYGSLEISLIKEKPKKKNSIKTRLINEDSFPKFLSFIKTRLELNEQIFAVVPRIHGIDEEAINIEKAKQFFLNNYKDHTLGIMHGDLSSKEKVSIYEKFIEGKIQILLSTSVIEVGINNPNATVMIIFEANNFGLSSLHQLRGRVARGDKPGFCFLLPSRYDLELTALKRLQIIENSENGFEIANEDLKLRGSGDLIGPSQSGHQFENYVELVQNNIKLYESSLNDLNTLQKNNSNHFSKLIGSIKNNVFLQKSI